MAAEQQSSNRGPAEPREPRPDSGTASPEDERSREVPIPDGRDDPRDDRTDQRGPRPKRPQVRPQ